MSNEPEHKYNTDVEASLAKIVVSQEFRVGKANQRWDDADYESYVDLLDGMRREKNYEWMSDVHIPEFASHQLAESANDVEQSFQTRDFTEVYIEDPMGMAAAEASKELINRTLNQRHLYYYLKHIRSKLINRLDGRVYFMANWERDIRREKVGEEEVEEALEVDVLGQPFVDPERQRVATRTTVEPVYGDVIHKDRFNFEIVDRRNVITDNVYTYSLQEKKFVIFKWPQGKTLSELKAEAGAEGYFNLDVVREKAPKGDVHLESRSETDNKDEDWQPTHLPDNVPMDGFKRFGEFWCKVLSRDENDKALTVEPGIDEEGKPLDDAELHEVIMSFALPEQKEVLIQFHLTPFVDADDKPYKPVGRGICYVHPIKDGGFGDALLTKELSIAIDDTFNVAQDRMLLGTYPSFKIKRYLSEENPGGYSISPGGAIIVDDEKDFSELKIDSDITSSLAQIGVLTEKMRTVDAVSRQTTSDVPALASTTATAVMGAEASASTRRNYKSYSFDYTFSHELYWMIQQMTLRFAQPETGLKLMGDKVYDFDPTLEYTYKPVSSAVETEHSRATKFNNLDLMLGKAIQVNHPDIIKMYNKISAEQWKLLGDEYSQIADALLDESIPIENKAGSQAGPAGGGPSNQVGIPQSGGEMAAREFANV